MRIIFYFCILLICVMPTFADDAPPLPLDELETLNIVFKADLGRENSKGDSNLTTTNNASTFKVERANEFPQRLRASQRIAVFLGKLENVNNMVVNVSLTPYRKKDDWDRIDSFLESVVELRFNGRVLCRWEVSKRWDRRLFIPKSWKETGMNLLEIRNLGHSPVEFNSFTIERYSRNSVSAELVSSKKKPRVTVAALRIAEKVAAIADMSERMRKKGRNRPPL